MVDRISAAGGSVVGGQLVVGLEAGPDGGISTVVTRDVTSGTSTSYEADAVVFAIGITGEAG
jgi:L-2-hydroxyglutarate oxidase LhgO